MIPKSSRIGPLSGRSEGPEQSVEYLGGQLGCSWWKTCKTKHYDLCTSNKMCRDPNRIWYINLYLDNKPAITFGFPVMYSISIGILNKADNIHMFLAHVPNMTFLVLLDRSSSTTAMLSHLICIFLSFH